MEKLSPNRAQLFVRNKYTVFTMGGTVALRYVNNFVFFFGELQFCSYSYIVGNLRPGVMKFIDVN